MGARARIFVYGTLRAGLPAHGLLAGARALGPRRTAVGFALYDLGSFPAMVRAGRGQVEGEVYEVGAALLARLDRYEGCPDLYVRAGVELEGGEAAEAYLMATEAIAGRPELPGGDYAAWWRARPGR